MSDVIDRLSAFFEEAKPEGVVSAYLYGSHAAGRAHRESDVDVGVVVDHDVIAERARRFDLRVRLGSDLIHALGRNDVDVVVLNDVPPELGREAVVRGRRVYCGDEALDLRFVRDVQLRAADVDIFLRRMRRIKLQRLRR